MGYPESLPKPGFHTWEITNEAATLFPLIPTGEEFIGAEVGSCVAKTATILLFRRPRLSLLLVDEWVVAPEQKDLALAHLAAVDPERKRHRLLHGDSTFMSFAVPDGVLDFAFIDASKEPRKYEADIRAWLPKIRPGGFIAGHDLSMKDGEIEEVVKRQFPCRDYHPNRKRDSWWVQL